MKTNKMFNATVNYYEEMIAIKNIEIDQLKKQIESLNMAYNIEKNEKEQLRKDLYEEIHKRVALEMEKEKRETMTLMNYIKDWAETKEPILRR